MSEQVDSKKPSVESEISRRDFVKFVGAGLTALATGITASALDNENSTFNFLEHSEFLTDVNDIFANLMWQERDFSEFKNKILDLIDTSALDESFRIIYGLDTTESIGRDEFEFNELSQDKITFISNKEIPELGEVEFSLSIYFGDHFLDITTSVSYMALSRRNPSGVEYPYTVRHNVTLFSGYSYSSSYDQSFSLDSEDLYNLTREEVLDPLNYLLFSQTSEAITNYNEVYIRPVLERGVNPNHFGTLISRYEELKHLEDSLVFGDLIETALGINNSADQNILEHRMFDEESTIIFGTEIDYGNNGRLNGLGIDLERGSDGLISSFRIAPRNQGDNTIKSIQFSNVELTLSLGKTMQISQQVSFFVDTDQFILSIVKNPNGTVISSLRDEQRGHIYSNELTRNITDLLGLNIGRFAHSEALDLSVDLENAQEKFNTYLSEIAVYKRRRQEVSGIVSESNLRYMDFNEVSGYIPDLNEEFLANRHGIENPNLEDDPISKVGNIFTITPSVSSDRFYSTEGIALENESQRFDVDPSLGGHLCSGGDESISVFEFNSDPDTVSTAFYVDPNVLNNLEDQDIRAVIQLMMESKGMSKCITHPFPQNDIRQSLPGDVRFHSPKGYFSIKKHTIENRYLGSSTAGSTNLHESRGEEIHNYPNSRYTPFGERDRIEPHIMDKMGVDVSLLNLVGLEDFVSEYLNISTLEIVNLFSTLSLNTLDQRAVESLSGANLATALKVIAFLVENPATAESNALLSSIVFKSDTTNSEIGSRVTEIRYANISNSPFVKDMSLQISFQGEASYLQGKAALLVAHLNHFIDATEASRLLNEDFELSLSALQLGIDSDDSEQMQRLNLPIYQQHELLAGTSQSRTGLTSGEMVNDGGLVRVVIDYFGNPHIHVIHPMERELQIGETANRHASYTEDHGAKVGTTYFIDWNRPSIQSYEINPDGNRAEEGISFTTRSSTATGVESSIAELMESGVFTANQDPTFEGNPPYGMRTYYPLLMTRD